MVIGNIIMFECLIGTLSFSIVSTCREDKYRPIGEEGRAAGTPGEMNQTLVVGAEAVLQN